MKRVIFIIMALLLVFCAIPVSAAETGDGDFSYIEAGETSRTEDTDCQLTVTAECPSGFGLGAYVILSDADGQMYRISMSEENGYKEQIFLKSGEYSVIEAKIYDDNTGKYPFDQTKGEEMFSLESGASGEIAFRLRNYDEIEAVIAEKESGEEEVVTEETVQEDRYTTGMESITISSLGDMYYLVEDSGGGTGSLVVYGNAKGDYDLVIEIIKGGVIGEAEFSLSLDGGETLIGDDTTSDSFSLKDYGLTLIFSTENDTDELAVGDIFRSRIPETFPVMTSAYGEANIVVAGSPADDHDMIVTILSSGARGEAKFTVSLDAGNSIAYTDTIPVDGIYKMDDSLTLYFSDSADYRKGTEFTSEIRSNIETVSPVPLYILLGVVAAGMLALYIFLLTQKERQTDYTLHKWKDRQESKAYE